MAKKHLDKVKHDYIRYANCWEDADILFEALNPGPGDNVISIASAGDNSFSLLLNGPNKVVAVDINTAQLRLVRLKKAAIKHMDREGFMAFVGFTSGSDRREQLNLIQADLSTEDFAYWEQNFELIENGLIKSGKFERYFGTFHRRIVPLIHSKRRVRKLFLSKSTEEQEAYYRKTWNSFRWRLFFKIFFSRFVMGRFGRDKSFMNEVEVNVGHFIFSQTERHLSSIHCQDNYFLHFILTGSFGDRLPHYVRPENYDKIRAYIDRLEVHEGLLEDVPNFDSYNCFNLSNIYEYMDKQYFTELSNRLGEQLPSGAKMAFWNLMVPRNMAEVSSHFTDQEEVGQALTARDKGFFYGSFNLNIRK